MQLLIVGPKYRNSCTIVWLEMNTLLGNIVIQEGHAPLMAIIAAGSELVYQLPHGKKETVAVAHQGIAEITRGAITILLSD